jgi:hypothetical protein
LTYLDPSDVAPSPTYRAYALPPTRTGRREQRGRQGLFTTDVEGHLSHHPWPVVPG